MDGEDPRSVQAADGDPEGGGNVAGTFSPSDRIRPQSVDLVNAVFVLLGVYLAVLALTRLFVDLDGFDGRDVAVLTAGTLVVGGGVIVLLRVLTPDT